MNYLSQGSSVKSFHSSEIKNLNEDQIVSQIKSMSLNKDILVDVVFIEILKEIMLRDDCDKTLIRIINFFWTAKSDNLDPFISDTTKALSHLDQSNSRMLLDTVRRLLREEALLQSTVLSIIPVLVANIRKEDNLFTGFIDITDIDEHVENIIPIVKVMREINTITNNEKILLIKKLLDMLPVVDLELCPDFVNEILHLCDKNTFQYCVGMVVNFFNQNLISCSQLSQSLITVDSRRLISIQMVVLNHYYKIAKFDSEFVKEILKFCKDNNALYSISGFMCIILLNLADLDYFKEQILDFMCNCIITCFKDTKLFLESAFIREALFENFDMDSLLLNAIKYCCVSEKERISTSLLELGFLLIKSGLPRSKVISVKTQKKKDETLISEMCNNDLNMSTPQKVGQAGISMIVHLFKKLPLFRQSILDNIQDFILKESHKTSVFVYLELFADLIALMPIEIFNYIDETPGQPIFELLCFFPHEVALALVNALLPLIRYSSSIRTKLLAIIMENILSGQFQARMICVESALILLKYLKVTIEQFGTDGTDTDQSPNVVFLTQCSQFSCTQISIESKPLPIDNLANNDICNQILQVIEESCSQHLNTKTIIYHGLVQVIERNFYFSGQVVLFLLEKLKSVTNDLTDNNNTNNPFIITKLLVHNNRECTLQEPLSMLVSCLSESVRHLKLNMPLTDILSNAVEENICISRAVSKAEDVLKSLLLYMSNHDIMEIVLQEPDSSTFNQQILIEQFIDLYDVLIVHFICSNGQYNEEIEKLFLQKEIAIKNIKSDKKNKKENYSTVISLSTLVKSVRYLFESLFKDIKNMNTRSNRRPRVVTQKKNRNIGRSMLELSVDESSNNNVVLENEENTSPILLNEKVSLYLLNKAINLVQKIGSSEYRISHRNRRETCKSLSEFIRICLEYYINCLCSENSDTLANHQRQIMQHCITLYCLSLNKVIQFCTKTIDTFLNAFVEIKDHITVLRLSLELIETDGEFSESVRTDFSMTNFIKLHKYIVSRILLLANRRFYSDIEHVLNLTLNIAIYCGIEDVNRTISSEVVCGSNRINITFLNSINDWAYHLLKSSRLHFKSNGQEITKDVELSDSNVCRFFVSLWLSTCRIVTPKSINYIEKCVNDLSSKMGFSNNTAVIDKQKSTFDYIIHPANLLTDVINGISLAMDDVDWLLMKWKCGWQTFKQKKAMNNSQFSNLSSTPNNFIETSLSMMADQDRHIFEQLYSLCSIMAKLIQTSIKNISRLHSLVKLCTRLFDNLTLLVKQYIFLLKSKIGSTSSHFVKLVRISGGTLSPHASQFIVYIQRIESVTKKISKDKKSSDSDDEAVNNAELCNENTDKKNKKNKEIFESNISTTVKDIRLIPNLVFSIEQYQRYLMELKKVSKVDYMSYVKTPNSRDFRFDTAKLQEYLDQNATVYMTDEEDNETVTSEHNVANDEESMDIESSTVTSSPPSKKQKLTLRK